MKKKIDQDKKEPKREKAIKSFHARSVSCKPVRISCKPFPFLPNPVAFLVLFGAVSVKKNPLTKLTNKQETLMRYS